MFHLEPEGIDTMNIREIAGRQPDYFDINREERNHAAILFAALCRPENARAFMRLIDVEAAIGPEFGIYFEYAYLRDLWHTIADDATRREIIRQKLPIRDIDAIMRRPAVEINRLFGVAGTPSQDQIQYPGKWSISKYSSHFPDNDDFLKICRFKWSFNIKPDIVIHLDRNRAICIEAKYESGEGSYPSAEADKAIFRQRGIQPYVGQTELQRYMMQELLGVQTDFLFLVHRPERSATHRVITWAEVFSVLDLSTMPDFAVRMARAIS